MRWEIRPPSRWPIALRAAIAIAIPLSITTAAGHQAWGLLCGTGVFTVLYGVGRPLRSRVRVLFLVAVGLISCMALGTLTAGNAVLSITVTALVGAVATFLAHALRLGAPGAFFFVLLVGIGGVLPTYGLNPLHMIGATTLGACIAVLVALFDLVLDRRGPERAAVAAANAAVEAFLEAEDQEDAEDLSTEATNAIHTAWTMLWDSGEPTPTDLEDEEPGHEGPPDAAGTSSAYEAGTSSGSEAGTSPGAESSTKRSAADERAELVTELLVIQHRYSLGLLPGVETNPDLAAESTSAQLGRPPLRTMIRRATRWPTPALQAAVRVTAGIAAAGLITGVALGTSHMYWAMAAAALVLHTGMDRRSTAKRSLERLAGTALGILLFLVGGFSDNGPWAVVVTIVLLQGLVELFVVRNYTLAVVFMTPLALTISTAGSQVPALEIAQERLLDTAIGVFCGALVPWFVGWRVSRKMVATHLSRVLRSAADVVALVATGRHDSPQGLVAQRELSLDLQELSAVAGRAIRDEPERVEDLVPVREATAWLGFTVMATASQAAPDDVLEPIGAAEQPARELSAQLADLQVPDAQEVRAVRVLVGRRPPVG